MVLGNAIYNFFREIPFFGKLYTQLNMGSFFFHFCLADAVSGARPGARHESVEEYIKRLSEIEDKASTFDGVAKVYAIQAGREIRVIVNPEVLDDAQIVTLAHDISQKLEKELNYPGQITVTVIRETRAVDIAK